MTYELPVVTEIKGVGDELGEGMIDVEGVTLLVAEFVRETDGDRVLVREAVTLAVSEGEAEELGDDEEEEEELALEDEVSEGVGVFVGVRVAEGGG